MKRMFGRRGGNPLASLVIGVSLACLAVLAVVTFTVAARVQTHRLQAQSLDDPTPRPSPAVATTAPTLTPFPTTTAVLTPVPKPKTKPLPVPRKTTKPVNQRADGPARPKAKPAAVVPKPANLSPAHLQLVNRQSGRCLDSGPIVSGSTTGLPYTLPCNGGLYQQWSALPVKKGTRVVLLEDIGTGLCLTVSPGTQGATKACNLGDPTQRWTWKGTNANSVYVQVSSGSCLTGGTASVAVVFNGVTANAVTPGACGGDYQNWRQQS